MTPAIRYPLARLLGDDAVVSGEALQRRPVDAWAGNMRAGVLVRPSSTEGVSRALAWCHEQRIPVVPQGGLTGLVHGAVTAPGEVVISLERLGRIEEIDRAGRTATVQAGVTIQAVQEAAEAADLQFPLDLGARATATIGGAIATNAGGMRVLRYGMMRSLVLGVEAVLADGTVLSSMNRMLKNNAGYDLKQLFIGSEGTLGIVTRANLRLYARPRSESTAFVACPHFEGVLGLLAHLEARLGGTLSAFEVLWGDYYAFATGAGAPHAPVLPHGASHYVIVESLGGDPATDTGRLEEALAEAVDRGFAVDGVVAKSDAERRSIWAPRENVSGARRLGPTIVFDVSLAQRDMAAYVEGVREAVRRRWPDGRVFALGHVADGNLHFLVAVGAGDETTRHAVEGFVYEPLAALGGSVSAEHGIGLERKEWLPLSRTPAEVATMRVLRKALDPRGILNRGKLFD